MNALTILFIGAPLLVIAALAIPDAAKKVKRQAKTPPPKPALKPLRELDLNARRPLSSREEKMFFALSAALPECTILAQISFQALLETPTFSDRNRFDRKHADYLICTKRLTPIAVIELDDSSHDHKKDRDDDRDAMLQRAGYQTIRYRDIPTTAKIREDMQSAITRLKAAHSASN